jgi:hypothetical protein
MKKREFQGLYVPFFETTIRYLGGLLGAYAMSGNTVLLSRADDLGMALLPAFNTSHGLPAFAVDVQTSVENQCCISQALISVFRGETRDGWSGVGLILSEIGSASLEFRALAHYTGRAEYVKAVSRRSTLRNICIAHDTTGR